MKYHTGILVKRLKASACISANAGTLTANAPPGIKIIACLFSVDVLLLANLRMVKLSNLISEVFCGLILAVANTFLANLESPNLFAVLVPVRKLLGENALVSPIPNVRAAEFGSLRTLQPRERKKFIQLNILLGKKVDKIKIKIFIFFLIYCKFY